MQKRLDRLVLGLQVVSVLLSANRDAATSQQVLPLLLKLCSCGSLLLPAGIGSLSDSSGGAGQAQLEVDAMGLAQSSLAVSGIAMNLLQAALQYGQPGAVWVSEGCPVNAPVVAHDEDEGTAAAAKPVVRPGFDPEEEVQAALQALVR